MPITLARNPLTGITLSSHYGATRLHHNGVCCSSYRGVWLPLQQRGLGVRSQFPPLGRLMHATACLAAKNNCLAAKNKCLAESNRTRTESKATNKRLHPRAPP